MTDTVPYYLTTKGETWGCVVTPFDGKDFGSSAEAEVTVKNSLPSASSLAVSPSSPYTPDNLTATYVYYDADGDLDTGTEIRWYRNDILQPEFNDTLIIPANATAKGETWYFTVRPKDGTDFGELQISPIVVIQNSAPSLSGVMMTPDPAYSNDTLTATPDGWFDADGDNVTYVYQWQEYQDGNWQNITGATSQTLGPENNFS